MSNVVASLRPLDIKFVAIFVAVLDVTAYGIKLDVALPSLCVSTVENLAYVESTFTFESCTIF